jgi:hypothetical protein
VSITILKQKFAYQKKQLMKRALKIFRVEMITTLNAKTISVNVFPCFPFGLHNKINAKLFQIIMRLVQMKTNAMAANHLFVIVKPYHASVL